MVLTCWIPLDLRISVNSVLENGGPLSETIISGKPKLANIHCNFSMEVAVGQMFVICIRQFIWNGNQQSIKILLGKDQHSVFVLCLGYCQGCRTVVGRAGPVTAHKLQVFTLVSLSVPIWPQHILTCQTLHMLHINVSRVQQFEHPTLGTKESATT